MGFTRLVKISSARVARLASLLYLKHIFLLFLTMHGKVGIITPHTPIGCRCVKNCKGIEISFMVSLLVSGSPFLKCQESQFMVEEGGVAQVCFVLKNAERLSSQVTITANVFPQNGGTANGEYNRFYCV